MARSPFTRLVSTDFSWVELDATGAVRTWRGHRNGDAPDPMRLVAWSRGGDANLERAGLVGLEIGEEME